MLVRCPKFVGDKTGCIMWIIRGWIDIVGRFGIVLWAAMVEYRNYGVDVVPKYGWWMLLDVGIAIGIGILVF